MLQANLYRVNKGDTSIIVNDYTSNNEEIEIELDPTLDPSKNLKRLFTKGKKAKNAIEQTSIQIDITKNEISYLDTILVQLEFANSNELDEITDELIKERYLKPKKQPILNVKTLQSVNIILMALMYMLVKTIFRIVT